MPDQSSAADEHAILQEITAPLATLPDDAVPIAADVDFPVVLRGYDRIAVDAYVKRTSQLVAELQTTRSPEAAVRRALDRVGGQIGGILQRAHDTAEQITAQSRSEAEDRLEVARQEAAQITAAAEQRLKDLDADTDRIWAERHRIVEDARELAGQLIALAESAAERFPPADPEAQAQAEAAPAVYDAAAEYEVEPESAPRDADSDPGAADSDVTAVLRPAEPAQDADSDVTAVLPPAEPAQDADSDVTAVLPPAEPAQDSLPLHDEPPPAP